MGIGVRHETGSGSESASRFFKSLKICIWDYIIHKFIYTPKLQLKHSGIRFIECIEFFSYSGKNFFKNFQELTSVMNFCMDKQ